ncbi:RNA polymerase sigma factor [Novosphingobium profundi]|uniref:RNA polymerase sigma factor n=1 Tax=Novosphingobium profundi TaxID=1774954 RepID=UPI001CFE0BB1|nr:sigma-70 family RNA polymerase sigma factor [Novosphingobium profundi]
MGLRLSVIRPREADHRDTVVGAVRDFLARRVGLQEAEDMAQEVALRLHQRRGDSRIESLESYAFQVARSVLTDRWRREAVRQREAHVSLEDYHHPVEEISPARVLEGKQRLARVMVSLRDLPDRTRQVFVLHRFEEMSYAAIASHFGISISAVEKHIMKAIRHLSACVGE